MFKPSIIEDAIVKIDGTNELIGVATVTLPDIEHKKETISGLGVDEYEYVSSQSYNLLNLTIKFIGKHKGMKLKTGNKTVSLIIKGYIGGMDDATHDYDKQIITCSVKGKVFKRSGGELGRALKNESELSLTLTYYKEEIDGEVVVEIDKLNKITVIDGEDVAGEIKQALN